MDGSSTDYGGSASAQPAKPAARSADSSPTDPAGRAARLPSLTGLRIFAAFGVFIAHQSLPLPQLRLLGDPSAVGNFAHWGQPAGGIAVAFFFVLSGFVLTWSARERDTARAFWRRRFVKIYPNYVVGWVLAMVLFAASSTPAWVAAVNLTTFHPWVPVFFDYISVNPQSWTLGVEALFYASFPLLYFAIRRIRPQQLLPWIAGLIAAIILTPTLVSAVVPKGSLLPFAPVSQIQYYLTYIFPPTRLIDFALGILLARAVQAGRWRNIGIIPSLALFAGCYAITPSVSLLYQLQATTIVPIVFLIAAAASADVRGRATLFSTRFVVWLGNISFAFYLVHYVVLDTVRARLGARLFSVPAASLIMAGELVIALAASAALYYAVERPMVRRWSASRRPRTGGPSIFDGRQLSATATTKG
jgi:peptidoglycan/LPS O-acetylase OafA/YrhL